MSHTQFSATLLAITIVASPTFAQPQPSASPSDITLELIMSDPDWIGHAPESPYWADDGRSFYYWRARDHHDGRDLVQCDLNGHVLRIVPDAERGAIDVDSGDRSPDDRQKVYSLHGDLFLKDLQSGAIRQLTRSADYESDPRFLTGADRIAFRRNGNLLIRELKSGFEYQSADVRAGADPAEETRKEQKKLADQIDADTRNAPLSAADYLHAQQNRLFPHFSRRRDEDARARARNRAEQEADPTRIPSPFYLGADIDIRDTELAPTGSYMIVRTAPRGRDSSGKSDSMPNHVTETGYVETRNVRSKVGTGSLVGESLTLLDLRAHTITPLDLSILPGITDDPLGDARRARAASTQPADTQPASTPATEPQKKDPRPVSISDIIWSDDGRRAVIQAFSLDSKDRWIASIDFAGGKLVPLEHWRDEAWINGRFAAAGFLRDTDAIWFLSEETGYSHLYTRSLTDNTRRALTSGLYEVSDVRLDRDGRYLYFSANAKHPGILETFRVDTNTTDIQQLTDLDGMNDSILSPDETHLLITHSTADRPPELFIQTNLPNSRPANVTQTVSDTFAALPWIEPQFIEVPCSALPGRVIHARLYLPPEKPAPDSPPRPAVMFVHGAGYLQDAHQGWSYYSHEFMFHSLLAYRGYVILDMDYRASAGYGRDWRTAIYRRMGAPELEDLRDGVNWLVANAGVDRTRVGVYGGSYGGFLTFMALFRQPDLFACGAALRPVGDWAHYNHGYTADILNTPALDQEAFEASSPIEFAEGLSKPLLICHGMQDDNVVFQDSVRLAQRLIELGKENWEIAIYPIEGHAFTEPASWLDEYRRIYKLFETNLK